MFHNYLLLAIANFKADFTITLIKLLSLILGITCSILVLLHVEFSITSNSHISNAENTYRLLTHMKVRETNTPYKTASSTDVIANLLKNEYGDQIPLISRIRYDNNIFEYNNLSFEREMVWVENDALRIFDLNFIQGNSQNALSEPYSVIISESVSRNIFGNEPPFGKNLIFGDDNVLTVTGVISDSPRNSTHPMQILVSKNTGIQIFGDSFMGGSNWLSYAGSETFLTLPDGVSVSWFNNNMKAFLDRNIPDNFRSLSEQLDFNLSLQPVTEIFLNPHDNFASPDNNDTKYILFGLIFFATLILLTSSINFINLTISQLSKRAHEIGIRKSLGASRGQVLYQFFLETILTVLIALALSFPLLAIVIPIYTNVTQTDFSFLDIFSPSFLIILLLLPLFIGLLSAILPASIIANLSPSEALSGNIKNKKSDSIKRNAITVFQFVISFTFVSLALATYKQISHMQNLDIGYSKEGLIIIDTESQGESLDSNYKSLLSSIESHPSVKGAAMSSFAAPTPPPLYQWRKESDDTDETLSVVYGLVGFDFIETWGLEIIAGRSFSEEFQTDIYPYSSERKPNDIYGVIISDVTADRLGFVSTNDALGEVLVMGNSRFRVIGVVKRFQLASGMESEQRSIGALLLVDRPLRAINLRVDEARTQEAIRHVQSAWKNHQGVDLFNYYFFSDSLSDLIFNRTAGLSIASLSSAVITIIIAILGLNALAAYNTARRTKEIGVRKVLGARSHAIMATLVCDFLKPVIISIIIAVPISMLVISKLYTSFNSAADFSYIWFIFLSIAFVLVSVATVSLRCYKVTQVDPVNSLRYE